MSAVEADLRTARPEESVLAVQDLTVTFGGNVAVDGFRMDLRPRERVGLIGPNGAGKSTCVNAITGHVKCRGDVILDGHSILSMPPHRRSRAGLVRTFQNLELFTTLTVEENITFGAALNQSARGHAARREHVERIMELLHLHDNRARQISTLAYGTRKLVELARALVSGPRVLLLDEPMAGLDTGEKHEFVEVLKTAFDESACAILLIEHDMFAVEQLTEMVHVLDAGKMIASGPFAEVASQKAVIDAYLGG